MSDTAEPEVFKVTGPGPGRTYVFFLLLVPIFLWIVVDWKAALIAVGCGVVIAVVGEALRDTRLKVIVADGRVTLGRVFGAPDVVALGEIRAVELTSAQTEADSPGLRVELVLEDGRRRRTPLHAGRGRAAEEAKVRAAAERLAELAGVGVLPAR